MVKEECSDGTDHDDADAERSRAARRRLQSRKEVRYKLAVHEEPYMYCRCYDNEKEREVLLKDDQLSSLDRKGRTYCDEEEGEEGRIVSASNTVIYPGAMVVTAFYTVVALDRKVSERREKKPIDVLICNDWTVEDDT